MDISCGWHSPADRASRQAFGLEANQANNDVADTGIPSAVPGGNLFSHFFLVSRGGKKRTQCWHIHSSYTQF
eukprot:1146806-Pelagomonas_calceolata.AAC.1